MDNRYELTFTADAEVIPGPLTKIRQLCEAVCVGASRDTVHDLADQILSLLDILEEGERP